MKRLGYTLFELAIVLALLVLLAGLAVPPLESAYSDYRLQSAVDQVRSQWAALRTRAIVEGRPYRFSIIPGGGDFRGAPDSSEFWGGGDPPAAADPANAPLVAQDVLPNGIRFGMADAGDAGAVSDASAPPAAPAAANTGAWSTVVVFQPDGTAQQDVEIVFRSRDAGAIALRLRALTGGVTARRPGDDPTR